MNMINMNDSIERYLSGSMNKDEEKWLLSEVSGNAELEGEMELRRRANKVLSDMSIIGLRSKLEAVEMKKRSSNPVRRATVRATKYAAAVAGAAIIASSVYFPNRNVSPEQLYERHFKVYQAISASRSADANSNALFTGALEAIKAKDYNGAIGKLEKILSTDASNVESAFMLGVANMEVEQFNRAELSFRSIIDQNDNLFLEDAAWYLGLCYMVTDEKDKALKQFEYIASSKSKYSKEARKLIRKLN